MVKLEEMTRVVRDIVRDNPPEGYTPEMIRWRNEVESEFEAWKVENPDAVLDLPNDISGLPGEDEPAPSGPGE